MRKTWTKIVTKFRGESIARFGDIARKVEGGGAKLAPPPPPPGYIGLRNQLRWPVYIAWYNVMLLVSLIVYSIILCNLIDAESTGVWFLNQFHSFVMLLQYKCMQPVPLTLCTYQYDYLRNQLRSLVYIAWYNVMQLSSVMMYTHV